MVRFTNPEEVLMALGLTQEMLADQLHITGDSFNELRSDPLTRRWKCSPGFAKPSTAPSLIFLAAFNAETLLQ